MSVEAELARMREVNLSLQRRLERARRDALLYAAQVCQDHYVSLGYKLEIVPDSRRSDGHYGHLYAAKLREIAK